MAHGGRTEAPALGKGLRKKRRQPRGDVVAAGPQRDTRAEDLLVFPLRGSISYNMCLSTTNKQHCSPGRFTLHFKLCDQLFFFDGVGGRGRNTIYSKYSFRSPSAFVIRQIDSLTWCRHREYYATSCNSN